MKELIEKLSADGTQLFSQKFSVESSNDELKIKGDPKEVREKVEFIPLEVNKNSKIEEAVMLRKELVEALITNAETPYDEDDRDSLVAMSEEKFENVVKFVDCKCKEEAVTTNKEEVKEVKEEINTAMEEGYDAWIEVVESLERTPEFIEVVNEDNFETFVSLNSSINSIFTKPFFLSAFSSHSALFPLASKPSILRSVIIVTLFIFLHNQNND